jgi:DNA repair protein RadD
MTQYVPRYYQEEASSRGLAFLLEQLKKKRDRKNGIIYLPTGAGKSIVVGALAAALAEYGVIGFQPTKEILQQNLDKIQSYGFKPEVFSASMGKRNIGDVTMATIGSVYKQPELFQDFQFGMIDECHLLEFKDNSKIVVAGEAEAEFFHRDYGLVRQIENQEGVKRGRVRVVADEDGKEVVIERPKQSMYKSFSEMLPHIIWIGLTASPYRLQSDATGSQLKVITRTRPKFWDVFVHYTQNRELFDAGYLAKLEYWPIPGFKRSKISANSTGSEFSKEQVQLHLFERSWETKTKRQVNFLDMLVDVVNRVLDAGRRNVLVFTATIRESEYLAQAMGGECAIVHAKSPDRSEILEDFKAGRIKVVTNVGVLVHGFDFPELECIVDASPTMSLARHYQKLGRGVRTHPNKKSTWIIDMVQGYQTFGPVEDLTLYCEGSSKWDIFGRPNGGTQKRLTSTYLGDAIPGHCPKCMARKYMAFYLKSQKWVPLSAPPPGSRANIVVRQEGTKKVCEMVDRGDPEATAVFHFIACPKFQKLRAQAG